MGHGSYGSWVKYSVGHMGRGLLEVTHRLPWLRVSWCGLWARTAHLCTEFEGHSFIRDDDMIYFDSEH